MKIKRTIKTVLPIFAIAIVLFAENPLIVKADKLDVIKTYTYSANSDGSINNPDKFFYVPSTDITGTGEIKRIVVSDYIRFDVPSGTTASVTYDIIAGDNSSGGLQIRMLRSQTEQKDYAKLYAGEYLIYNVNGDMDVKSLSVTIKDQCYYEEYKDAISRGLNWTLVNGDVATAECICKTKCTAQSTNTECPVCKTDIAKCTAKEEATSNTSNTDAAKAEEEKKKAEEAKKAEEQKKAQEATTKNAPTTADSGVATTASADPSAVASEELALAQGQASQIIADAQLEAQAIIETANGQAEIRLAEANEQASQILLDAGITVGEGNKSSMPLGGMIALIILIIAVIGEGGVIAYTLLKNKLK